MDRIDAHIHYLGDHPSDVAQLEELGLKLLNICIPRPDPIWRRDKAIYRRLAQGFPRRFAWCGGFDPPGTDDLAAPDGWIAATLDEVARDLEDGAVGIKVWKCIGMEIRKPDGSYLMIDDPIFRPIWRALAQADSTLLAHIGEPRACWRPLSEDSPHRDYYRRNPQWHMAGRTDIPSHQELIAARDRVVETHPDLRFIGAHLGSLEYDVDEVAARFERYENFAVDTSSRLLDLAAQERSKVRRFFERFHDRILFGTDIVLRQRSSELEPEAHRRRLAEDRRRWQAELDFLTHEAKVVIRGREVEGLGLGADLVHELSVVNPRRWYPRLAADAESRSVAATPAGAVP